MYILCMNLLISIKDTFDHWLKKRQSFHRNSYDAIRILRIGHKDEIWLQQLIGHENSNWS